MIKMLQQINDAPLTAELMQSAMEAVADLPAEDRTDLTARMLAVLSVLRENAPGLDRASLALAINFRLTALARLMTSDRLAGFRLPAHEDGPDLLHEDVVRTAVEVPLRDHPDGPAFDPAEFRKHLLFIASPAGEA